MPILLFILWIIFNGRITTEICIFGVVLSAAITYVANKYMGYTMRLNKRMFRTTFLLIEYYGVLFLEIAKANLCVTNIILNKNRPLRQSVRYFDTGLKSTFCKMLLANSITLTPGTITVSVDGSRFEVHCLSYELLDGIEDSKFVEILKKIESR